MTDAFRLDGRVALVTGANTGIGQATAIALAAAGASVICASRRDSAQTLRLIAEGGGKGHHLPLDLGDMPADVFADTGAVDIVVNNAGIIRRSDAVDLATADWDEVMDVNLTAAFRLSQGFARAVFARQGTGAIVNIASLLSFQGGIRVASYTASKHGLAGLTKVLANEWAARGINVNAVAPGYIETENTRDLRADPDRSAAILARIPAGRWGMPQDIAGAVVFLASPAARYIHGAVLNVDGGWLAR